MDMITIPRAIKALPALLIGFVLIYGSATQAVQIFWTGAEDSFWSNTNNWNPVALPTADDEVVINNSAVPNLPVIVDGDIFQIQRLTVRVSGILTMEGGSLDMVFVSGRWRVGWRNGDDSYMTVNGGTIDTIYTLQICEDRGASGFLSVSNATVSIGRGITLGAVAGSGTGGEATMVVEPGTTFNCATLGFYPSSVRSNGRLTMNGGLLNLNSPMTIYTGGVMRVYGGLVQSTDLTIDGEGENGLVDIYDGMWQISSNIVTKLEGYANDGKLIGYGGDESIIVNYNDNTGITTVTAVPEPVAAVLTLAGLAGLCFRIRVRKG